MASAKEIPPGGEGQIDVTFKTGKAIGPIAKSITVTSNDPVNPSLTLQVKADLEALFVAKPDRVHAFPSGSDIYQEPWTLVQVTIVEFLTVQNKKNHRSRNE